MLLGWYAPKVPPPYILHLGFHHRRTLARTLWVTSKCLWLWQFDFVFDTAFRNLFYPLWHITWKYHNLIITWCHSALLEHWHLGFPLENLYLRIFLFAISPLRHNFSYCASPKNVSSLRHASYLFSWVFSTLLVYHVQSSKKNTFPEPWYILVFRNNVTVPLLVLHFRWADFLTFLFTFDGGFGSYRLRPDFNWAKLGAVRLLVATPKKKGYVDVHSCYKGPNTFGWRVSCFQVILAYTLLYYHYSLFLSDHLTIIWTLCSPSRIKLGGRKVLPTI